MTRTHILYGTVREWTDEAGKRHKARIESGAIFKSKGGNIVVKIDALPVRKNFEGWLSAEPCAPAMPRGRKSSPGMPPPPEPQPDEPPDDKPF